MSSFRENLAEWDRRYAQFVNMTPEERKREKQALNDMLVLMEIEVHETGVVE